MQIILYIIYTSTLAVNIQYIFGKMIQLYQHNECKQIPWNGFCHVLMNALFMGRYTVSEIQPSMCVEQYSACDNLIRFWFVCNLGEYQLLKKSKTIKPHNGSVHFCIRLVTDEWWSIFCNIIVQQNERINWVIFNRMVLFAFWRK